MPKCQIVLGRFEEVAKPKPKVAPGATISAITLTTGSDDSESVATVLVGREYARKELFDDVKVPDQPFGKWFRGTTVPKAADRSCFLLNGNRQSWHYGWQSSRLNCKNLHVFKVYVFNQSESDASALSCVAELASPPFRISSSRKARKTFRSPVMRPLVAPGDSSDVSVGAVGVSRVPSIDELLSKAKRDSGTERFPSQQRRSLVEPLALLEAQAPPKSDSSSHAFSRSTGYPTLQRHSIAVSSLHAEAAAAATAAFRAENDHSRRERKRLTRSASLKTEYYTNVSFPPLPSQTSSQTLQPPLSLSATHPLPQFAYHHPPQQPQQQPYASQQSQPTLPSVAYMNGSRHLQARRSSLAALPMPSPAPLAPLSVRTNSVTTPIMDMMQLRLESPHPPNTYRHQPHPHHQQQHQHYLQQQQQQLQQRASLPAFPPSAMHAHAYGSTKATPFLRRDAWPAVPSPPVYFPMIPASSPEGYLNRKRNRSTDSDKGLLAAIQASEALLASARGDSASTSGAVATVPEADEELAAMADETDTVDLHRRARVLQLAFTIVKRIHRFEEVSKASASGTAVSLATARVYRHSFEMMIPSASAAARARGKPAALVQIPLSNHQLQHLCSSLVAVCTSLLSGGLLLDLRHRLVEYAQAGVDLYSAYAQVVDFVDDAVHELVCQLPKRMAQQQDEQEQWDLYDLLKNAEPWLLREPWWCVTDEEDEVTTDSSGGPHADLPYYNHFADLFHAVQSALPSPRDLEVAASLRDAAMNGVRGLTGEWVRQGNHDEPSAQRQKTSVASASASPSWLSRQIHGHISQIFHVTETATTMTLALPNSLISSEAVFLFDLDRQEPTVVVPQDYFPFSWARKRLMVAYRAWRVRGIGDENGSAVAVQFMRWPDERTSESSDDENDDDDDDGEDDEPEEEPLEHRMSGTGRGATLLRTRVTIYFSVFSHNRLQVRTIVEGSMASAASSPSSASALPASHRHPTEADMLQYFKSPSSWELMSQVTQEYERKSMVDSL